MEIKFKGYDETGKPVPTPSKPKYIPIRITDMTFEVTVVLFEVWAITDQPPGNGFS